MIEITYEEDKALHELARETSIKHKAKKQLDQRKKNGILVGFHHGALNPLPSYWKYPNKLNLLQMITLWLMGSPKEKVPALRHVSGKHVVHFDKNSKNLNRMKMIMKIVKHFALLRDVWEPRNASNFWNGVTVTRLWDCIYVDLKPYLLIFTKNNDGSESDHKSRCMMLASRYCYDRFVKARGLCRSITLKIDICVLQ